MLAWSEGTDNGRQKTRNHGYDVIVGRRAIYWLLRSPSQTCHAKPKTQISRRRTLPASFPLVGCLPQTAWPERLLEKVRTLACSRLRSVALYYDWSWWYPSGNRPLQPISGLHCRALVMVGSSIRLTAWLQNSSGRNGQRLMYERSHRDYLALVICIIVCLSWAVNHYRDNAITYKPSATKMPGNWSWRTWQLLTCRCVSVMLLRSMQNTRRVSWC